MAVILVTETWFDRDGSFTDEGIREYTRHFNVFTNDVNDTAVSVLTAPGIPQLYDQFVNPNDSDTLSCVERPECRQDPDDPFLWRVTVHYSTKVLDPSRFPEDPLQKPTIIQVDTEKFRSILRVDAVTGNAILNSAQMPFDPPPEVDDSRTVLTFTRNEETYDFFLNETYRDTVNSTLWSVAGVFFPKGTAKCDSITGRTQWQAGKQYWEKVYKFHLELTNGWVIKLLDQGYCTLDATNHVNNVIRDQKTGQALTQPSRLDGNGQALATNAASVFLTFNGYAQNDFNQLNLP